MKTKKKTQLTDEKRMMLMLGYLCVATEIESSLVRKIEILERFGLLASEIAMICKCNVQSVRDAQQKLKRR